MFLSVHFKCECRSTALKPLTFGGCVWVCFSGEGMCAQREIEQYIMKPGFANFINDTVKPLPSTYMFLKSLIIPVANYIQKVGEKHLYIIYK